MRDGLVAMLIVVVVALAVNLQSSHAEEMASVKRQLAQLQAGTGTLAGDAEPTAHRSLQGTDAEQCYTESQATVLALQGVGKLYERELELAAQLEDLAAVVSRKANASALTAGLEELAAAMTAQQVELEELTSTVATKADSSEVSRLATTVAAKADAGALSSLASSVCVAPCAVVEADCVGVWSQCAADCSEKAYTVSTPQSGAGRHCDAVDGATLPCDPGEGDCPALPDRGTCGGAHHPSASAVTDAECGDGLVYNVANAGRSCEGSECDVVNVPSDKALCCIETATCGDVDGAGTGVSAATDDDCGAGFLYNDFASESACLGAVCDFRNAHQDTNACCTAGTHCVGSWSMCTAECGDRTYTVSTAQSGAGRHCDAVDGAAIACMHGEGECARTHPRTCGDTNADGVADDFTCLGGNVGLTAPADRVTCAEEPCTAAECCIKCADDTAWSFFDRGSHYDCAGFVAEPALGAESCEETWAVAEDVHSNMVTAYEACQVSCPSSATQRVCAVEEPAYPCHGFSCPETATAGPMTSTADAACLVAGSCTAAECCVPCQDEPTWRIFYNGANQGCSSFVSDAGVAACEEQWAVGTTPGGAGVSAHEACGISCPVGATPRRCTVPGVARTCADTDADGARDLFACPAGNTGLVYPPESVLCAGNPCTASECCTTCADDLGWVYSDRGDAYDCASFIASGPGVESCEEDWATGTDSGGATTTAYESCAASCPASEALPSRSCVACPTGAVPVNGTCTSCLAGRHSSRESGQCVDCAAGRYSDAAGREDCAACAAGKYGSAAGSDSASGCVDCAAGRYGDAAGRDGCVDCAVGRHSSVAGSANASDCVAAATGGSVMAFGNNENGQLGDGRSEERR